MSVFTLKSTIRINCAKRIGQYLKAEVEALGYKVIRESETGVDITGTLEDCMRLNLNLRSAYRVLFLIDEFEAATPDELYRHLVDIPWEEYIDERGYISISSFVENIHIRDTRFANLRVKDAIVDRIMNKKQQRPDSGSETDRCVIFLYWRESEAAIFFDTSGETISKHAYRKAIVKAPMQESLAAAVVLATKWDRRSNFINPMCGSGTLAIEAALLAIDKAPNLGRRNFGFMHIKDYDDVLWHGIRNEAKQKINRRFNAKIIATDIDERAIRNARENAHLAGVEEMIDFSVCSFEDTEVPPGGGCIVINPAYGERIGEEEKLEQEYKALGDFLKTKGKGYTGYIFTGNLEAAKRIGLKASRRIPFYNGTIDCRLLEYELYEGTRHPKEKA